MYRLLRNIYQNGGWLLLAAIAFVALGGVYPQSANAAANWVDVGTILADEETDDFGEVIAIDGDTLVVADKLNNNNGGGAVFVFVRSGNSWVQQAKLVPNVLVSSSAYGSAVAISGDTIVVGSPERSTDANFDGAAYVFVRNGTTWSQQAILLPSEPYLTNVNLFGIAVAISGDTIFVGDRAGNPDNPPESGQLDGVVYAFARDVQNETWLLEDVLFASEREYDFGDALAFDGTTLVISAPDTNNNSVGSGSVYIYTNSGAGWEEATRLLPSDAAVAGTFGRSLALDGTTLLIGDRGNDEDGVNNSGAAYVFTGSGSSWTQQAKLRPDDLTSGVRFGTSVAVNGDIAVIGSPRDSDAANEGGAAYTFTRNAGNWSQQTKIFSSTPNTSDMFGMAVVFDGDSMLVGAPNDEPGSDPTGVGVVDIFVDSPITNTPPTITSAAPSNSEINIPYTHTFTATGDVPITYAVTSGTLPTGLTLSGATISGTPTAAGTFAGVVTATNNIGTDPQAFSITISPGEVPPRLYPEDGATLTDATSSDWPQFTFQHVDGIEWYQLWIGTDTDVSPVTQYLFGWYPATSGSSGATGAGICDTNTNICTIPTDIWLTNGNYSWWMTYWGPNDQNFNEYWNETTFNVNFGAPSTFTLTSPADGTTVSAEPTTIEWVRDTNVLWYQVWVGPSDYSDLDFFINWEDATEICDDTTCILDVSNLTFADDDYEVWVEMWGPEGYVTWLNVNSSAAAATFTVDSGS